MADYERHVVFRAEIDGRFYFAPKVKVLPDAMRRVVGQKYDITDHIAPYLLKKYRPVRVRR